MKELEEEFTARRNEADVEHERQLKEALDAHNSEMAKLEYDFDEKIKAAQNSYEEKKDLYEKEKDSIDSKLEELNTQTSDKIAAMNEERSRLLEISILLFK